MSLKPNRKSLSQIELNRNFITQIAFALISLLLWCSSVIAGPKECGDRDQITAAEKVTPISRTGKGYFHQAFENGKYMSFTMYDGGEIFNLKSGEALYKPYLRYDPFPSPDGLLITIPGLKFFLVKSLISGEQTKEIEPLFTDTENIGFYQSVGLLEKTKDHAVYRVMTGRGFFADYRAVLNPTSGSIESLNRLSKKLTQLCGNSLKDFDFGLVSMPMISKDGREFSAIDTKTHTTHIWKITNDQGDCIPEEDLGFATGKVSFSFDGKKLAFHADRFVPNQGTSLNASYSTGIFIYDRPSQKLTPIATGELAKNSSFYPVFLENGKILYGEKVEQALGGKPVETSAIIEVDPAQLNSAPVLSDPDKIANRSPVNEAFYRDLGAIGGLWEQKCDDKENKNHASGREVLLALKIPEKNCKELVKKFWTERIYQNLIGLKILRRPQENQAISIHELLETCEKKQKF